MVRRLETQLSAAELVKMLTEGGWIIDHNEKFPGWTRVPVESASFSGETVLIKAGQQSFEVPGDKINQASPWALQVLHTYMRKQQRKKSEGGGWQEVPAIGVLLELSNPTLEQKIRTENEERTHCEKDERGRRESEELNTRRESFLASLSAKLLGKKLVGIEVVDGKLIFHFEDNLTIEIDSDTSDCCGYNCGSAVVNGVSLDDFRKPEFFS